MVATRSAARLAGGNGSTQPPQVPAATPKYSVRLPSDGCGFGMGDVARRLRQQSPPVGSPVSPKGMAAVLVPLYEDEEGEVQVVLTQRSAKMKTHSGEVCLPGGKRDPEDVSDIETALREAQEELGLEPTDVEVLCQLPPLLSKHMLSVTPVVARIPPGTRFVPNPSEVEAVFHMPLRAFLGSYPAAAMPTTSVAAPAAAEASPPATNDAHAPSAAAATAAAMPAAVEAAAIPPAAMPAAVEAALIPPAAAAPAPGEQEAAHAGGPSSGSRTGQAAAGRSMLKPGSSARCRTPSPLEVDHEHRDVQWAGFHYRLHYFQHGPYQVWGLTAAINIIVASIAFAQEPSFEVHTPGKRPYTSLRFDGQKLYYTDAASGAAPYVTPAAGGAASTCTS